MSIESVSSVALAIEVDSSLDAVVIPAIAHLNRLRLPVCSESVVSYRM